MANVTKVFCFFKNGVEQHPMFIVTLKDFDANHIDKEFCSQLLAYDSNLNLNLEV